MRTAEVLQALAAAAEGAEIVCRGSSMEPTLRAGERVRVRCAGPIRRGDVVLIASADGSRVILHRVVAVLPGTPWLVHCGDAGKAGEAGVARIERVIAHADVSRRRPPLMSHVSSARALLAALRRRVGR